MSKNIKTNAELFEIDNRLRKLEDEYKKVDEEITKLMGSRKRISDKVAELRQKKHALKETKELRISEHAVLRYMERIMKIDLTEIERELLTDDLRLRVRTLGGSCEIKKQDYTIVIKDYIIITIIKE